MNEINERSTKEVMRKTMAEPSKKINILPGYDFPKEISALFTEYTDMLIANDPTFRQYLDLQHYDDEMNHLETKYGMPEGRLYLAYCGKDAAGCIGLRKIDGQTCEMKRLYVRPAFRGAQIGQRLVQRIIADAKEIGYSCMLLDTLPFLNHAIAMYKKFGFYEIESYNNSPMDTSIYMRLDLTAYAEKGAESGKNFSISRA